MQAIFLFLTYLTPLFPFSTVTFNPHIFSHKSQGSQHLPFATELANSYYLISTLMIITPSIPNFKSFWLFQIHISCYVSIRTLYLDVRQNLCIQKSQNDYIQMYDKIYVFEMESINYQLAKYYWRIVQIHLLICF